VVASRLAGKGGITALEVNISCPNVSKGGILFGRDPDATAAVIETVRREIDLPLVAKLPPLPGCIEDVAVAARDAGADALGVSNTLPSISIDIENQRPRLGGRTGGLSGPPLKPVALYLVYRLAASAGIPVIGIGGIETSADAIEFILAGASAFEVGSVIVKWLNAPSDIIMGLEEYMEERGYGGIEDFRGKALV
jgi:dihydroorotate dehydrogenase (NAD+) catalytic subunit